MIANIYQPNQGICAHVDLLRFDDSIVILSLESDCVMHFTNASLSVPVHLTPGSFILMSREALYHWFSSSSVSSSSTSPSAHIHMDDHCNDKDERT
ncbi:hypothetical protein VIGAN_07137900 [Vigna angularis var. angularis]|uniref:Fe2OG dioxygenase domain-containing protein n=1 Tax=Vigna angularis var. angularis TaxID=157739 RepID=A0A0S3SIG3_PHAAN|nr:hypothetical protein VIGAN_07137900 [Vigna angularis var. angularis]